MPRGNLTFRVFVSSTFTDMRAERRILQEDVFPRLKSLCESKGATFQDVDLRWGVNEESQLDQKTMDICLGEIARCQRLSPKPNFILLLGDKYGWQPVPVRIPSSEMALILSRLGEDQKMLVLIWYREDTNAIPPEYVLQAREGDYLPYEAWAPVEARLRDTLRQAVAQLPFTEEQKVKYFASATHQEILAGALSPGPGVIAPEEHVFAYLRTIRDLPEDPTEKDYIDLSGDRRDAYSKTQLEKVKQDLKARLPHEHIYDYEGVWNKGCVLDDAKAFGEKVYTDLSSVVEEQLQGFEDIDPLTKEIVQHEEFKNQRLEHFTGRQEALNAIAEYLSGPTNKVFSIIGASGTGKTSLMAKATEEAHNREGIKVFRFLGTTSATSDVYPVLSGLITELISYYGVEMSTLLKKREDETKFSTLRGLQEILPRCLSLASSEKPLLMVIDGLDQLSRDYTALSLDWIPKEMPEHVKMVVSALPELQEKLAHTITYDLGGMSIYEGEALLKAWLSAINRTLQPQQMQEVMNRFAESGVPLYLKLAFEKARNWHSYSANVPLKADIDGVLDEYFTGLEKNHGNLLVQKVCGYLLSGKYQGLMEQEVLDLLVFDEEHWDHFLVHCHPDHRQEVQEMGNLPMVVWSRLFLDLESYLTERDADGLNIISFYHRKFVDLLCARYLSASLPYHRILAGYFERSPLYLDEKEQRPHVRKMVEQPFQETLSGKWTEIGDKTFAYFPFLMAKAKANMVEGILEDYAFLWDRAPETAREHLGLWRAFFTERIHILRRGNSEWPAYKILLQLAVEHADDSPVTIGAELFLCDGRVDWVWLRRMQRAQEAGIDPCIEVLEGHTENVKGALKLANGRVLSWAGDLFDAALDHTLRIWDAETGQCQATLEGHNWVVSGVLELTNGRIVSWTGELFLPSKDHTLRVWDAETGQCQAVLEGHTDSVDGALKLTNGGGLSWSLDGTLRIWDAETGQCQVILEGHTGGVRGALELRNGSILSWSLDGTLRLWDAETGQCLAILEGHTGSVDGALELTDGRILSWSSGGTLRIWDAETGQCLAVLVGHDYHIGGALELGTGRILSWSGFPKTVSSDHTLRIWDTETGRCLAVLKGHSDLVMEALELTNGRILSRSFDRTLRIWDAETGQCRAVMEVPNRGEDESVLTGIRGALELPNGHIHSWTYDDTHCIWDPETGNCLQVLGFEQFCMRYPESIPSYLGNKCCSLGAFAIAKETFGQIQYLQREKALILCARWHGESKCDARHLKEDGRAVLTQANGQVCFLRIYHGNKPISVKELEELYGV